MSADERPTSARLRQVEAERDEIRAAAGRTAERLLYARTELGRVQSALAASQADLTRVEAELDGARAQIDSDRELIDQLIADRADLRRRLAQAAAKDMSTPVPMCTTDPTEES